MRRWLSSHFYSGKVPLVYILWFVQYNISTQVFSRDMFPLSVKVECSLYLGMRSTEFQDEWSSVLFILLYMKGGSAGPWVTQKINRILDAENPTETMWAEFTIELNEMFADPNCQATAQRKLATL